MQSYKLYVAKTGKGRPVILLHGGFSSHAYWRDVEEILKGSRELFEPDLLGFGKSPKPRQESYSVDQYVACLEKTFADYKFSEPPVLVGHSMGALIALHWAAAHPRKFAGLVLSAPVFFKEDTFRQQIASIMYEHDDLPTLRRTWFLLQAMGHAGKVPSRVAVKFLKKWPTHVVIGFTSHSYHVFKKLMGSQHFAPLVLKDVRKIAVPMHIILGERDLTSYPALEELQKACEHNKRCDITIVPTGHQIPLEHPDKVAEAILST